MQSSILSQIPFAQGPTYSQASRIAICQGSAGHKISSARWCITCFRYVIPVVYVAAKPKWQSAHLFRIRLQVLCQKKKKALYSLVRLSPYCDLRLLEIATIGFIDQNKIEIVLDRKLVIHRSI